MGTIRNIIEHDDYTRLCLNAGMSEKAVETVIYSSLKKLTPADNPEITHMLGVPGAGKTTFITQRPLAANTLLLGFDNIMESLPGYQKDVKEQGVQDAFNTWERPARALGYEILFRALESRFNVLFDNGGSRADHIELLSALKQDGYTTKVIYVSVDEETAKMRAAQRARHLPPHYIRQRQRSLMALLPAYRAVVDVFEEYDVSKTSLTSHPSKSGPTLHPAKDSRKL